MVVDQSIDSTNHFRVLNVAFLFSENYQLQFTTVIRAQRIRKVWVLNTPTPLFQALEAL